MLNTGPRSTSKRFNMQVGSLSPPWPPMARVAVNGPFSKREMHAENSVKQPQVPANCYNQRKKTATRRTLKDRSSTKKKISEMIGPTGADRPRGKKSMCAQNTRAPLLPQVSSKGRTPCTTNAYPHPLHCLETPYLHKHARCRLGSSNLRRHRTLTAHVEVAGVHKSVRDKLLQYAPVHLHGGKHDKGNQQKEKKEQVWHRKVTHAGTKAAQQSHAKRQPFTEACRANPRCS